MAAPKAPTAFDTFSQFVDPKTGLLTEFGLNRLNESWKQYAAGYVIVPVTITGTNVLTMTPLIQSEGGAAYGQGMAFFGAAAATTTGLASGFVVGANNKVLPTVKIYKANGTAQATTGDIVINGRYLFIYDTALDGGNGGFVLK